MAIDKGFKHQILDSVDDGWNDCFICGASIEEEMWARNVGTHTLTMCGACHDNNEAFSTYIDKEVFDMSLQDELTLLGYATTDHARCTCEDYPCCGHS